MIDSHDVCRDWLEQLRRNQSTYRNAIAYKQIIDYMADTHLYGLASQEDGTWRDKDGKEVEGAVGKDPGKLSWIKGIVGAVQRVRGAGEF